MNFNTLKLQLAKYINFEYIFFKLSQFELINYNINDFDFPIKT